MKEEVLEDYKIQFDLRQRRAKFIADCIDDVIEQMKLENYYLWLKNIDDLYSVSKHTFQEKRETENEYNKLRNIVVTLANNKKAVWTKQSSDSNTIAEIEQSLRNLFQYVLDELEGAGVFGTKFEDEDEL